MNTTMNDTQTSRDVEQLKNGDRGGPRAEALAQFVIEDHALRHSWHHLARIRAALGR